jgi:hypothetical protein
MKQLNFLFLTILSTAFLLTSCKKDNDGPGIDAGSGKVTATVDGQSWESKDEVSGAVYGETQGTHTIQAYHTNDSYIALTIFGNITSGTSIQVDNSGLFQAQYKPVFGGTEVYSALGSLGSGTITFSTFNENSVKGTFEFTGIKFDATGAETPLAVTNGSFDINL